MRRLLSGLIALLFAGAVSAQSIFPPPSSGLPAGGTSSNILNGTPAWVTALPNGVTATTQTAGDATTDVANDNFVAQALQFVNPASAANEATTTALPNTPTYANGTAGVGATLTSATNTALTVDGVSVALNDRVLVKNQASALQNGVYTETQVGTGSVPWILTRSTDYNTPQNINWTGTVPVIAGTTNALTNWLLVNTITTIGTDAITYAQQTSGGSGGGGGSGNVRGSAPFTKNQLIIGQGGNSIAGLGSAGTSGQLLQSNGASAPSFVTALANGTTATTQAAADNSTKVATTAYADNSAKSTGPIVFVGSYTVSGSSTSQVSSASLTGGQGIPASGYNHLRIRIYGRSLNTADSTGNANVFLQFNGDTTSGNYLNANFFKYQGTTGGVATNTNGAIAGQLPNSYSSSVNFGISEITISGYSQTTNHISVFSRSGEPTNTPTAYQDVSAYSAAAAITSFQLTLYNDAINATANFAAGTLISVYAEQ